jgi:hypothetical protein
MCALRPESARRQNHIHTVKTKFSPPEVVYETDQVRVMCHWHGGNRTLHPLMRPVARLTSLSTYGNLVGRAAELRRDGPNFAEIAETLNQEGWRPAKRRDTFNAPMVHHLLVKARPLGPNIDVASRRSHVGPMNG